MGRGKSKIDENVLRNMYDQGFTFQEMASHFEIGKGAIAGKCHRMGLSGRRVLGINLNQNGSRTGIVKKSKKSKISVKKVSKSRPKPVPPAPQPPDVQSIVLKPNKFTIPIKDITRNMSKADLRRMLREAVENT
jgi:hypothetical protein